MKAPLKNWVIQVDVPEQKDPASRAERMEQYSHARIEATNAIREAAKQRGVDVTSLNLTSAKNLPALYMRASDEFAATVRALREVKVIAGSYAEALANPASGPTS